MNNFVKLKKCPGTSKYFVKLPKESFYEELANTVEYRGSLQNFLKLAKLLIFVNKVLVDLEFLIKE